MKDETQVQELTVIDPKEYGIDASKVASIEQAFQPKIIERNGYEEIYKELITQEITPELVKKASELRKKLVKTRTGISDIHKAQKAYFLASGKYVDAWKNKETLPVTQMEENLREIENHFVNIENERIENLQRDRETELEKYEPVYMPDNLGKMETDIWESYILGQKTIFKAKKQAEKEEALNEERNSILKPFWGFVKIDEARNLGKMSEVEFNDLLSNSQKSKFKHEKEVEEEERLDNLVMERKMKLSKYANHDVWELRKMSEPDFQKEIENLEQKEREYEEEQAKIRAENEKLIKELQEEEALQEKNHSRQKQLTDLGFVWDGECFSHASVEHEWADLQNLSDNDYSVIMDDTKKRVAQWIANEKKRTENDEKERKIQEEKIKAERAETKRLAEELKSKEEAEQRAIEAEEARVQAELSKGDAAKKEDLINDLEALKTKYEFKSEANKKMYEDMGILLDQIKEHVK